jgi:hypothetical protein
MRTGNLAAVMRTMGHRDTNAGDSTVVHEATRKPLFA